MSLTIQRASLLVNIPTDRQFKKWMSAACAVINQPTEITLRIVNAAEGRNLNSAFRGKDYATNVLTFVYHEKKSSVLLGDIILCAQVVAHEARAQQKILAHHYAHLTIHGVLHMVGMDHETPRQANKMEALEIKILASLGIGNPYIDVSLTQV